MSYGVNLLNLRDTNVIYSAFLGPSDFPDFSRFDIVLKGCWRQAVFSWDIFAGVIGEDVLAALCEQAGFCLQVQSSRSNQTAQEVSPVML